MSVRLGSAAPPRHASVSARETPAHDAPKHRATNAPGPSKAPAHAESQEAAGRHRRERFRHAQHHEDEGPKRKEKDVLGRVKGSFFGADVSVNIAESRTVNESNSNFELVRVAGLSGSQAIETNLAHAELANGQKLVLHGPGLKLAPDPARPVSAQLVGVGLSSSLPAGEDGKKVSCTASVKVSDKTVLELAAMGGEQTAELTASTVAAIAGPQVAEMVGEVVLGAVPVVSAALAANSVRRAINSFRDEDSTRKQRAFAVAHAVCDAVRVACPPVGIAGAAAVTGVEAGSFYRDLRQAKKEALAAPGAQPPGNAPPSAPVPSDS